jgi:adenine-specific DNA-methyltransferase
LKFANKAGRAVFSGSKVDAIVTLYAHWKSDTIDVLDYKNEEIKFKRTVPKQKLKLPYAYDWLFSDYADLLEKIEQGNATLSKYGFAENACATSDAYKLKEFIQEAPTRTIGEAFLRVINTGTIGKYLSRWGLREMTYLGNKYKCPVVKKSEFVRAFRNSYGTKSLKPKVIIKGLNLLDACLDPQGTTIPGKTTLIATASDQGDLKLLLAVLNSSIAFFYLKEKYPASSYNQGTTFTKEMLNSLPVPNFSDQERKQIIELVTKILANGDGSGGHAGNDQLELNRLMGTLYGLSDQELAVIDNALM